MYISRSSEINTYADDTQFFISGQDPVTIQYSMQADLQSASEWIQSNGMGLNVDKCFSMWVGSNSEDLPLQLGNRNLQLRSSMKLLGITIDNALNFHEHVSKLVRKVSNQLQVLKRHKRLLPTGAKKRLYEAFILSHLLNYCSIVWNHCGKKNADKLEKINERCLRFVFNDFHSTYDELFDYINQPCLQDRIIHDMLTLIYRALNGNTPVYIKNLLNERDTSYNLRGQHLLNVPRVNTTNYGLHSFRYSACKLWSSLPNSFRTAPTTNAFKLAVNQIKFNSDCCSFCNFS